MIKFKTVLREDQLTNFLGRQQSIATSSSQVPEFLQADTDIENLTCK